jgi:hypothetical protein
MSYEKKVVIQDANIGKEVKVTPFGELRAEQHVRVLGESFWTTLDTNFWTSTVTAAGTNTITNGELQMRTGTTSNGTTLFYSTKTARYVASYSNYFSAALALPNGATANNVRRWGAFDASNGCFFDIDATSLGIVTRKAGSDQRVAQASWNGGNTFTLDTNIHYFEIIYTSFAIYFLIDDVLMHSITAGADTWCVNIHFPIRLENNNSGGSVTNVGMDVRSTSISRNGAPVTRPVYRNLNANGTTTLKQGPGCLHRITFNKAGASSNVLTIYDNTTNSAPIIGAINTTSASMTNLEFGCDFYTGLTVVLATGTAADITVIYE